MASVTIRKIDESVKAKLRIRAAERGHSLEQELRQILIHAAEEDGRAAAARTTKGSAHNAADAIIRIVDPIGGIDLDLPPRSRNREPPRFDG